MSIVTLTTDFGGADYYVGALKGVVLSIAPRALPVDLCHGVPPQDVLHGSFVLRHAAREFPPDSIHLAVVDPGVGSARRALAVHARSHFWVAPDNGILSFLFDSNDCQVRAIDADEVSGSRHSATFAGRDLFAPAAAHLAAGLPFERLGPLVADPVRLDELRTRRGGGRVGGSIIHVDHFGNLVSGIAAADLDAAGIDAAVVDVGTGARCRIVGLSRTYSDVAAGNLLALIGSVDLLEVSINGGSAAAALGLIRGDPVIVARRQPDDDRPSRNP